MAVERAQAHDLDAVQTIYEAAFPPAIRAPWESIRDHRADEALFVLRAEGPREVVVGFALLRHLGETSMAFVRYLAVDAERRSRGLGAALLTGIADSLRRSGCRLVLLDVEAPVGTHAADDRRRIGFYQRHGFALLDVPDYAPPAHGSTADQVPLLLMGRRLAEPGGLTPEEVQAATQAVYRHRYGVDGPAASDPE